MWGVGQWLWDRDLKQPVQFQGIQLNIGNDLMPAVFQVIEPVIDVHCNGETTESFRFRRYPFKGAQWWKDRYTTLYVFDKGVSLETKAKAEGLKIAL